ncbi:uncharacterized protein LOC111704607 isoform X1 [Eurytemora carolleeae]|uniref:uncharacterized protein LOC111704607 isoform X1 n=1 Tax=Eurytemora carolleeae TaxID=1294199 RepID=UPI000C773429|nr:uncharacterized protein LOC111704607 isoform X1 [Eurytemora carolleeae]|eukprot:XP_023332661.1 uncharacterized protein LOC111704607 isoform X1 [Eurytemora affinis]
MDISVILLSLITMCLSLSRNSNDPLILTGEIIDVENYTIIGHHNYINGSKNEIHGYKSVIKSDFSIIRGSRNKIDGRCNTIFGDFNVILGERNLVAGSNNKICGLANGVTTQGKNNQFMGTLTVDKGINTTFEISSNCLLPAEYPTHIRICKNQQRTMQEALRRSGVPGLQNLSLLSELILIISVLII